ncbi:MAG: methyl-accepting chemotaxis protein [Rhodospirillaceae bacterium]|jgi:methyl-accepting chemotaxis protein|nr:methyl-accepting chemotaxis protein [Rhodospirillales bacterium]MBT3907543.1 methyl-accepting chemotaxis protein [Rhodospirillaceae bacterium]MBT4700810.1 methyl-accepting chemotaxis protein [Rhodospirillaceae bacterium]MBT5036854.1 methyl-accepting chemotaxis protein [Rhodospirillaceae bacterium]MBT6219547.1 methyl-accepting chemotaxis protein [Rhodospirillaceae bacterium]
MFGSENKAAISKALKVCEAVAEGDFEARILDITETGEAAQLLNAINRLIDKTDAYVRESTACLDYVSRNKYYRRIVEKGMSGSFLTAGRAINTATQASQDRVESFTDLAGSFEMNMANLVDTMTSTKSDLQSSAKTMTSTAEDTSTKSTVVAAAAEETSANLQTVAAATEELSSSISEISRQVVDSNKVAQDAADEAQNVNEEVKGLAERATKIGEVVSIITDIAEQTNLLALNATIEAARAGDAGKGFAVVASEVKNLANQTAQATENISAQVGGIQGATQTAVDAILKITQTINKVSEGSTVIAAAVEEQGAATREIARNVEQASGGMQEVTVNISGVSNGSQEVGEKASLMLNLAGNLTDVSDNVEELKGEFGEFIIELKKTG